MHRQTAWVGLVVVAIGAGWSAAAEVTESSDREVEAQIRQMRQRVKELVEAGHPDEAERVEQAILRLQNQKRQHHDPERKAGPDLGAVNQRLGELTRRLAELKDQGRDDEAEHVARQIKEIREDLQHSTRGGRDQPARESGREREEGLADVKRRIAELEESGRHDEADRLAQEARQMMRGPQAAVARGQGEGRNERIRHIREAARHLHAAGLHDAAENLMRQAEQLAREADVARQGHERGEGAQLARQVEELSQALREIRQKMERIDKRMQELSEQIERR